MAADFDALPPLVQDRFRKLCPRPSAYDRVILRSSLPQLRGLRDDFSWATRGAMRTPTEEHCSWMRFLQALPERHVRLLLLLLIDLSEARSHGAAAAAAACFMPLTTCRLLLELAGPTTTQPAPPAPLLRVKARVSPS